MSEPTSPTARRPGWFYRVMKGGLGLLEHWLHLSCQAFIRLVSAKYEWPLSFGERMRQAIHRMMCDICRLQERRMDQLNALAHDVAHRSADDSRAELSPESIERMRKAMAEAAGKGPTGSS